MIQNIEDLTQARETAAAEMKSYDCRVLVCSGTGCIATGSNKIHQLFQELIADDPAIDLQFAPHDAAEHDGWDREETPDERVLYFPVVGSASLALWSASRRGTGPSSMSRSSRRM